MEADSLLDKDLLDILACPACRAGVVLTEDRIVCTSCGRRYPVRDGIPIMLVEEAESGTGEHPAGAGNPGSGGPGRDQGKR